MLQKINAIRETNRVNVRHIVWSIFFIVYLSSERRKSAARYSAYAAFVLLACFTHWFSIKGAVHKEFRMVSLTIGINGGATLSVLIPH